MSGGGPIACPACEAARQRARAEGHRNWRTGFVCFDHAAVDLNGWMRENGMDPDAEGEEAQP